MPVILQINVVANWGSTGRIAEEIGQAVIHQGWDSYIAYGRKERLSKSHLIKIGNNVDVFLHVLCTRLFDLHGLMSQGVTKELISQIEKVKPDIVHLHNLHGYYLNYNLLFDYFLQSKIPVVWTLHDCWSYTGHCVHYTDVKCEKWKDECFKCPQLKRYPASFFLDRCTKNLRNKRQTFLLAKNVTLVPVSFWLSSEVQQSFWSKTSIYPIYNGVDTDLFKIYPSVKNQMGIEGKVVLLGVANVWDIRKGLSDFLNLAKLISDDTLIILVGLSKRQIKKMPLNIIGIERTESTQQLAFLYSSADLFINTSVEETFGLTTVESLSCGTPALVYNTTACPEIISEDTGFMVEPHDIDGILNAIRILKDQGKSYYSQACRDRAVRLFNKKDRYAEYIQLYKKILNI